MSIGLSALTILLVQSNFYIRIKVGIVNRYHDLETKYARIMTWLYSNQSMKYIVMTMFLSVIIYLILTSISQFNTDQALTLQEAVQDHIKEMTPVKSNH